MLRKMLSTGLKIGQRNMSSRQSVWKGNTSRFFFAQTPYHPTIQKIIEGGDIANIQEVIKEVDALEQNNREIGIKLLLRNLFSQKLPVSIIEDEKFIKLIEKHPQLYIDSQLFLIKMRLQSFNELLMADPQKKQNIEAIENMLSQINSIFNRCFQEFNKLPQEKRTRPGITINKRFADYYLFYMVPLVTGEQKQHFLKTALQVYRNTVQATGKLIQQDGLKVRMVEERELQSKQMEDDKKVAVHTVKQNLRMLVETNSQNVLSMFRAINEIQRVKNDPNKLGDGIIECLSNMERALQHYNVLQNLKINSIFYHHLKKIKCEVEYYYKLSTRQGDTAEKKAELQKSLQKNLNEAYEECREDLEKIANQKNYLTTVAQISVVMFQIRFHLLSKNVKDADELKYKLVQQIQTILEKVTNAENKKIVESKLVAALQSVFRVAQKQAKTDTSNPKK